MPIKAPKPRSDTGEQILDLAEMLIQTRGYSAFSYQDISAALGIRKASIHYHFASKTDLGVAVVDRYVARFAAGLAEIAADTANSSMAMLDHYAAPYLQFAATADKVCLCGALAGEMMALPPELRVRVDSFFKSHQAWLAAAWIAANSASPPLRPRPPGWCSVRSRARCWSGAQPQTRHNCAMSLRRSRRSWPPGRQRRATDDQNGADGSARFFLRARSQTTPGYPFSGTSGAPS
jgi:AcrR family transcriptional regulator